MRVAVTGGGGFVGRFLVEAALARGDAVTLLTRRPPPPGVAAVSWDLAAPPPPLDGFDLLIHAALDHLPGRYRGGEGDDPARFAALNFDGTAALFAAAARAGVPRVAFLSSRAIWDGLAPGTPLDEDLPARPASLYGRVKAAGEAALAESLGPGRAGLVLRATGVYGPPPPGRPRKWADLVAAFLAGRAVEPRAGTEVHGADLAAALDLGLAAARPGAVLALNVSDLLLDRHDLLALVARLAGSPRPPPPRAAAPVSEMATGRLRALGWRPRGMAGIEAELRDTLSAAAAGLDQPGEGEEDRQSQPQQD